ncbi:metal ABC transporter permease [Candidatus Micrarchaeota archaeon]|nr:metal ABC transporter permease [Candidatus Micrarchaeota archaeon]
MFEILGYGFVIKALIGGVLIGIACSLIGIFLVLKRLSLFGDGLAHVAFGGVALGFLLGIDPFISALAFTAIGAVSVQKLLDRAKLYGDAATAIILSVGMSLAVLIIGYVRGFNVNLFSFLFGSILTLSNSDLIVIFGVVAIVCAYVALNFRNLLLFAFNSELLSLTSKKDSEVSFYLSILTAMTVVITMRAVGILLVSALIVMPAMSALTIARSFKQSLVFAMLFAVISVIVGIIISAMFDLPSGATIVLTCFLIFVGASIFKNGSK